MDADSKAGRFFPPGPSRGSNKSAPRRRLEPHIPPGPPQSSDFGGPRACPSPPPTPRTPLASSVSPCVSGALAARNRGRTLKTVPRLNRTRRQRIKRRRQRSIRPQQPHRLLNPPPCLRPRSPSLSTPCTGTSPRVSAVGHLVRRTGAYLCSQWPRPSRRVSSLRVGRRRSSSA